MIPVIEQIQPARPYTVQVQPLGGEKESPWEPDDEGLFDEDEEDVADSDEVDRAVELLVEAQTNFWKEAFD